MDIRAVRRKGTPSPPDSPEGRPMTGVVVRIVRGQSHGYIRATGYRAVFFHRIDVADRAFNDLAIGDRLAFRVIDDRVSGPRAIHVRKAARKE